MPEDKLTREERIRLEAFSQACHAAFVFSEKPRISDLFKLAEDIERWLRKAPIDMRN